MMGNAATVGDIGAGSGSGSHVLNNSYGGGLDVERGTALATYDTQIIGNTADIGADWNGTLIRF